MDGLIEALEIIGRITLVVLAAGGFLYLILDGSD